MDTPATVTLWRPVGPEELALIRESGMRAFPPRLPGQPIFYPVVTEDYAIKIARDWNVPDSGSGFVTCFAVRRDFLDRYRVEEAGGRAHREYWIPAEDLSDFNAAIVGEIEVTHSFP
ncbi:ADP-ribosylation/crystallin J1 [Stakelama tenebrarum]|uniref:ADP-ribosylation/crystallin J1 n=1 Tax=Stakelama tenebrarum TaxID=2711215 RepID=A0A6G6Y9N8_9SPHN|nr:ADP-ribosylation/crystallin J1 [Sphingosinithalassobacter tenebrarum]QIG81561.1 ADP-ribosylation/crystallin J1 [Sphingosinithalassobacter tenebrarum]